MQITLRTERVITSIEEFRKLSPAEREKMETAPQIREYLDSHGIKYQTEKIITTDEQREIAGEIEVIAWSIRGIMRILQTDRPTDPETLENIGFNLFTQLQTLSEAVKGQFI